MAIKNYQQTICTVPRTDMNPLLFDRLDLIFYDKFSSDHHMSEDDVLYIKNQLPQFRSTQGLTYTDEQLHLFADLWNNAPKRPLAPYEHTFMGHMLKEAVKAVCKDIQPMRCPDDMQSCFYELNPEICKALIKHLNAIRKENDYEKRASDFESSMAMDLFDIEEVFSDSAELVTLNDIINVLKKIQKQDFTKKMSYIFIS